MLNAGADSEAELETLRRENLTLQSTNERQRQYIVTLEAVTPSFLRFGELPKEIRHMIWKHTCIPRVILMDWTSGIVNYEAELYRLKLRFCSSRFPVSLQIPVSAACRESRDIFEKDYERIDNWHPTESNGCNKPTGPIYINFHLDTILLPDLPQSHYYFDMTIDTKIFEPSHGAHGLRYLAILGEDDFFPLADDVGTPATEPKSWLFQVLRKFPLLEELLVVGEDWPREGPHDWDSNRFGTFKSTDCKFVAFGIPYDRDNWDSVMTESVEWADRAKDNYPGLASLKISMAGLQQTKGPGDYEPKYIKIGPIEERSLLEARFEQEVLEKEQSGPAACF